MTVAPGAAAEPANPGGRCLASGTPRPVSFSTSHDQPLALPASDPRHPPHRLRVPADDHSLSRYLATQPARRTSQCSKGWDGAVGIDGGLIAGSNAVEVVELASSLSCCSVRASSPAPSPTSPTRRPRRLDFDQLVIETTGLADPAPVAWSSSWTKACADATSSTACGRRRRPCMPTTSIRKPRRAAQIGFADRVLLTKRPGPRRPPRPPSVPRPHPNLRVPRRPGAGGPAGARFALLRWMHSCSPA